MNCMILAVYQMSVIHFGMPGYLKGEQHRYTKHAVVLITKHIRFIKHNVLCCSFIFGSYIPQ